MILHPGVIALLLSSALILTSLLYSTYFALMIIRKWDLSSGSEEQLKLERQTYLISTLLSYIFALELLSLFLFIHTVEKIHPFFIGAMCAAGSLKVNPFGYLTLFLKLFNFFFSSLWLIINYVDQRAYDYPLIRVKYGALIFLGVFLSFEAFCQTNYLIRLRAEVITSCCGSLFSAPDKEISFELDSLPSLSVMILFFLTKLTTLGLGLFFYLKQRGAILYSLLSLWGFLVDLLALVTFISLFIYELPTHHCPFCMLKREYHYVGYPLYATSLANAVFGLAVGLLNFFKTKKSLTSLLPLIQRRFCLVSLFSNLLFILLVLYEVTFSSLKLLF